MSNKVGDFFVSFFCKKRIAGQIYLNVNVLSGSELCFRIEAAQATVEWGDGTISQKSNLIEPFSHKYEKTGVFRLQVKGTNITDIDIPRSNVVALDVSQCPTLEFIDCSDNQITELDLHNCRGLYEVYCAKNRIRELKLSKHRKLFYLSCSCNELTDLDLSGCRKLVTFRCRKNLLSELDFRKCRRLVSINVEQNDFTHRGMMNLVASLVKRSRYDTGFIVLQHDSGEQEIQRKELTNLIARRGWCEI